MSLVELIARADERGLAASGLACLDRCVPLLGGDDELLRPLWATLTEGGDTGLWGERLEQARDKLGAPEDSAEDEAAVLARRMLDAAPPAPADSGVRVWADACSVASLQIHRLLDAADDDAPVDARREGRTEGMPPLVAAELRRQITVLELLAGHGAGGLRPALEVSTEGRRVLRAVVSRRARGRS
ncbi:hypothetical protein BN159_3540 [Streptomyces davaonensis JCM 4913]|uniref:Uncharacterized protein n=1 Tax=Streptomyces davaonensis (strain DSM 101723 / JCM 4913 / KCC S-0913 / 768) TaxID=1214101 RepID=K4R5D7_STRDJ|nr:hypothetical protein [Streptomyces davaonensis]CCK27919.1 hypothetical protein BN159_3540 [Streptomyces davaonensis JCM 4913]